MERPAGYWIDKLNLTPHPEGGYYREVYRSVEIIDQLPTRYKGSRCFYTSIYFLLAGQQKSAFHKISSDETWHFYNGAILEIHMLKEDGSYERILLGEYQDAHPVLQYAIPHGTWFAAKPVHEESYSLIGCTVAPGFEFADYELGQYEKLSKIYPKYLTLLKEFCLH